MKILYRKKIKNQIYENLAKSKQVYTDALSCLSPANSLFWCHNMDNYDIHSSVNEDNQLIQRFQSLRFIYLADLDSLVDIYNANIKLTDEYKELEAFSTEMIIIYIENLNKQINKITQDIKSLEAYKINPDLKKAVTLLNHLSVKTMESLNRLQVNSAIDCTF